MFSNSPRPPRSKSELGSSKRSTVWRRSTVKVSVKARTSCSPVNPYINGLLSTSSTTSSRNDKVQVVSQTWLKDQTQLLEAYGDFRSELTNMTRQFMEERVELRQEIDQFGLVVHDLEANLNNMIEASKAHLSIVVDSIIKAGEIEEQVESQVEELIIEIQQFDHRVVDDAEVEKLALGSSEVEEQGAYFLKFVMPRRQNDIPHLKPRGARCVIMCLAILYLCRHLKTVAVSL